MSHQQQLKNKKFRDWVKGGLALKYLRDGLQPHVEKTAIAEHQRLLLKLGIGSGQVCKSVCTIYNLEPDHKSNKSRSCPLNQKQCNCLHTRGKRLCPDNICHKMYDEIVKIHAKNEPFWKNSDMQKWSTEPWELAKCFINVPGYVKKTASETDVTGFCHVLLNNTMIRQTLGHLVGTIERIREKRNVLAHSSNYELEEKDLNDLIADATAILKDVNISTHSDAQTAVRNLQELQDEKFIITNEDVEDILKEYIDKELQGVKRDFAQLEKNVSAKTDQLEEKLRMFQPGLEHEAGAQSDETRSSAALDQKLFDGIKSALIEYYREHLTSISMSPLREEDCQAPLADFYVMPSTEAIDTRHRYIDRIPTKTPVTSYQQMLFTGQGTAHNNIYVTANPGVGKTAFSKRFCVVWCQAHDPQEPNAGKFKAEDIHAMLQYDILIYISMREIDRQLCELDDIVQDFISSHLSIGYSRQRLNEYCDRMLHEKSCLIVLDGLDEWNHPQTCTRRRSDADIPHQKQRQNSTVVTTTRPWRFDVARLPPSMVHAHIEIKELDESQSEELVSKAFQFLGGLTGINKDSAVFLQNISESSYADIQGVPYMILQCVCLWFEDRPLGESKFQLYANVLELTLERGHKKLGLELPPVSTRAAISCFKGTFIAYNEALLVKLGKLAFFSLFDSDRQMLVVDVEYTRQFLDSKELKLCLQLGLLSQNKSYEAVARTASNVSFAHKSIHEMFCSLYIISTGEGSIGDETLDKIKSRCTSVSSVLEMSNIFIFCSGMDSLKLSQVWNSLRDIFTTDENIYQYRNNIQYVLVEPEDDVVVDDIQTLQTNCVREMELNRQPIHAIPLEDIIIDKEKNVDLSSLKLLLQNNSADVKSLCMRRYDDKEAEYFLYILKPNTHYSLEKLDLEVDDRQRDIEKLLVTSTDTLITLHLRFAKYRDNTYTECSTVLSRRCVDVVTSMPVLQALQLGSVVLEHEQLQTVTAFITSRVSMTHVGLLGIRCSDHVDSCDGIMLDLSRHERLLKLVLVNVPISRLQTTLQSVQQCQIGKLPSSVIISTVSNLPTAQHLEDLVCYGLRDAEVRLLIETIPRLLQLRQVKFFKTDLRDRRLRLTSEMKTVGDIKLIHVTMTCSALWDLAETLSTLTQSVYVLMLECTVTPAAKFPDLKNRIKTDGRFTVAEYGPDKDGFEYFRFHT